MNLEEIRKLNDIALNLQIQTFVGVLANGICTKCGSGSDFVIGNHWCKDWSSDLNAIAEVEKLVIEKTSLTDYGRCLVGVTEHHGLGLESTAVIATASARQRAEACLLALS